MFPPLPLPETQFTLALSIFLFTFAYEDGATLLAATLAAAGRLDVRLGFASAFLGIWAGDMGLYILGSTVGRRISTSWWLMRFIPSVSLDKAESWFARRGTLAIVMSRFVPGSRLPLYVAAGALRLPASLFSTITGLCSVVWVTVIFTIWHFAPAAHLASGKMIWWLAAAMLLAPWFLGKTIAHTIRAVRVASRQYQRWEFWPAWLFYPPVVAMCAWLALKYRGLSLPTVANPSFRNGGIVGESKIEVLQSLMSAAPGFVADGYLLSEGELQERLRTVERTCKQHSITYPFVLKPNVGQRGAGFKLVTSPDEAEQYLASVRSEVILQRYISDEKEIGVFYYRYPGSDRGELFAVTEKVFPTIVGDGVRPFEELLDGDDRASIIRNIYLSRFAKLRGQVLASGQRVRLVEAGNHCQGCVFRDGGHLISDALQDRLDQISRSVPGFFIGRYDIRYSSDDDLRRGENFQIIELNGAASEATNIYDERNSLLSAYRMLYKQWELVYRIGRANRDRGFKPASVLDVLSDLRLYAEMSRSYPAAD